MKIHIGGTIKLDIYFINHANFCYLQKKRQYDKISDNNDEE